MRKCMMIYTLRFKREGLPEHGKIWGQIPASSVSKLAKAIQADVVSETATDAIVWSKRHGTLSVYWEVGT